MNLSLQRTAVNFRKIKGFEAKIFALILLFLPVNLAKHFVFNFCYVDGILVDYLIPTIYLTDILIWCLLGFWGFREVRRFRGFRKFRWSFLKKSFTLYFRSIPPTLVGGEERKEGSKGGYSLGRCRGFKAPDSETPFYSLRPSSYCSKTTLITLTK